MNCEDIIWFGRYEGWLKWLARGVKNGDDECLDKAAGLFDLMLPDMCAVVPMPSHTGRATTMLRVAERVCAMKRSRSLCDVLACKPHESSYDLKKAGVFPPPFEMSVLDYGICSYLPDRIFVIDNVVCTGATVGAASRAFAYQGAKATMCAIAYSPWR